MSAKILALVGSFLVAAAGPASAHITLETGEAPAGSTYRAVLRVGHGCETLPTTTIRIQIPDGVVAVEPVPKPGWTLETIMAPYSEPVTYFDQTLTQGVREVIWKGGSLPDGQYDEFVFDGQLQGEVGQILYFPVVQECGEVVSRWIDIPTEGQNSDDLEEPAPAVTLTAPIIE